MGLLALVRALELKLGHDDREDGLHLDDGHRAADAVVRAVDERLERVRGVHRRGQVRPALRPERLRVCAPQSGRCVHSVDWNRHELTLRNEYLIDEGT